MSQWTADSLTPPVSGYERPTARCTVPPIFSSNRIVPTGRSMPKFVPIPISPSARRAGVGGERLAQVVLALVGARRDDPAGAELELDPLDRHAARARRDREADVALGGVLDRAR